jgi:GTP-binding protein HflX
LLLELVDATDAEEEEHRRTTEELLKKLELEHLPRLRVFNKIDRLDPEAAEALTFDEDAVLISAIDRATLGPLLERIEERLVRKLQGARPGGSFDEDGFDEDAFEGEGEDFEERL